MTGLSKSAQTRNLLIFATCTALQYFAAPANYVGTLHTELCQKLGASAAVANLPESMFFVLTISPLLLSAFVQDARWLKPCLAGCYLLSAVANGQAAAVVASGTSPQVKIASVILQGTITGAAMTTAIALLWEAVGRGVPESRRGMALSLAFGCGSVLAVVGSLGMQAVVTGSVLDWKLPSHPDFPLNYASVFGATSPAMLLAAVMSMLLVIPDPEVQAERESPLQSLATGIGDCLRDPVIRMAIIVTVLLYVGNTITGNMTLQAKYIMSKSFESSGGYQLAIRFCFKVAAGLSLGWLLSRSNPRAGIMATGLIFITSQIWAILANEQYYLIAFGLYGAGELVGVYAPNYILSASPGKNMRRNMGIVGMLMLPTAGFPYLFGGLADLLIKRAHFNDASAYRVTFALCTGFMAAGLLLALARLPRWPRGEPVGSEASPASEVG